MNGITVFDCNTLVGTYENYPHMRSNYPPTCDAYQTAIMYVHSIGLSHWRNPVYTGWYKMDSTPLLIADVPKEYLTLKLMLDL